jgi:hypothetical protein
MHTAVTPDAPSWPAVDYPSWSATCDTLHAEVQVLGKLALVLAPPEPQLQHGALRVTARGWETPPLRAPDGSGTLVVVLDLRRHQAVVEHADGREERVPLSPDRTVADVTSDLLAAVRGLVGEVEILMTPQETPWTTPLDQDRERGAYDPEHAARYLRAANQAAHVLSEFRAPFRGRATPVNAWWGSFDLAVSLFSGRPAEPPSQDFIYRNSMDAEEIAVGWWPGDGRYPRAAFFAYAYPAPDGVADTPVSPGRWDPDMRLFVYDWEDARAAESPQEAALAFLRSFADGACRLCAWEPALAGSLRGVPPPVS